MDDGLVFGEMVELFIVFAQQIAVGLGKRPELVLDVVDAPFVAQLQGGRVGEGLCDMSVTQVLVKLDRMCPIEGAAERNLPRSLSLGGECWTLGPDVFNCGSSCSIVCRASNRSSLS